MSENNNDYSSFRKAVCDGFAKITSAGLAVGYELSIEQSFNSIAMHISDLKRIAEQRQETINAFANERNVLGEMLSDAKKDSSIVSQKLVNVEGDYKELLEVVDAAIARAKEFKPDVVGVSAGFDGYKDDRLLDLNYSLEGYYQCGKKLSASFDHIFAVLEGGYHMDIKKCTEEFIRGVNGL